MSVPMKIRTTYLELVLTEIPDKIVDVLEADKVYELGEAKRLCEQYGNKPGLAQIKAKFGQYNEAVEIYIEYIKSLMKQISSEEAPGVKKKLLGKYESCLQGVNKIIEKNPEQTVVLYCKWCNFMIQMSRDPDFNDD
jgi:hypothetical protein